MFDMAEKIFIKQAIASLQEDLVKFAFEDLKEDNNDYGYFAGRSEGYKLAAEWLRRHIQETAQYQRLMTDVPDMFPKTVAS